MLPRLEVAARVVLSATSVEPFQTTHLRRLQPGSRFIRVVLVRDVVDLGETQRVARPRTKTRVGHDTAVASLVASRKLVLVELDEERAIELAWRDARAAVAMSRLFSAIAYVVQVRRRLPVLWKASTVVLLLVAVVSHLTCRHVVTALRDLLQYDAVFASFVLSARSHEAQRERAEQEHKCW